MKSFRDYKIDAIFGEMKSPPKMHIPQDDEEKANISRLFGQPEITVLGPTVQTGRGEIINMLRMVVAHLADAYPDPLDALREIIQAAMVALAKGKLGINFSPSEAQKVFAQLSQEAMEQAMADEEGQDTKNKKIEPKIPGEK